MMAENLPNGWQKTTLGEVCRINPRPTYDELPPDETKVSFVPMAAVEEESGRLDASEVRTLAELRKGYTPFKENDVIFAKITPCMENGKVALATGLQNGLAYGSTEFFVFRPYEGLLPRLVLHFLLQSSFREGAERQMTGAVGQKRVPSKYLSTHAFPLPPTREQERIVTKVDTLLSRVAAGEAAARRALQRLQSYRAAVLHAAATGEITANWRKTYKPRETGGQLLERLLKKRRDRWEMAELKRLQRLGRPPKDDKWKERYHEPIAPKVSDIRDVPSTWSWASVEQLTPGDRSCAYGVLQPGPDVPRGVLLVRVGDIKDGDVSLEGMKRIAPHIAANYERTKLEGGELLITLVGAIGRTAIVPDVLAGANTARAVGVVPLTSLVNPHWIELWFRSPAKMNEMVGKAHEVARKTLNLEDVRSAAVPVPPLDEQTEVVREVQRRLAAAARLTTVLSRKIERAKATRQLLLREAFRGNLVPQNPNDEPASVLLERIRTVQAVEAEARKNARRTSKPKRKKETASMNEVEPSTGLLQNAWQKIGAEPDAKKLFQATGLALDQVVTFYGLLRSVPEIVQVFKNASKQRDVSAKHASVLAKQSKQKPGRFRLVTLWLEDFKNLKDYKIDFGSAHGLDVVLGWNGTGKSNVFEALVIIFRDLHYWVEKNKWTADPMAGYDLIYEIEDHVVQVKWSPSEKRPSIAKAVTPKEKGAKLEFQPIKRESLILPRFIFGYYSGPTNRLAEHFLPMKRDHYDRLRKASSDDPQTLARLLEQRRFFCAETHHAKYVLLAFSYKEDNKIRRFLEDRLRIIGFESALFVIRKPRWGKGKAEDFWGATGIMRRVMEKLRRYAIAPMVLQQIIDEGYHQTREDHYYFYLPDLKSLHDFAAEYADARTFFLALESTDFSELIYDVKIQVRVKAADNQKIPITFRELSEGEQQLLMVLGLMRFTKSHQSLILLDEPDTHLNPHWSVEYLKDLAAVVSDNNDPSPEQQTSQLLMATHDPLVIASLVKEQIHLLKRDSESLSCSSEQPSVNPRGLGFTGILTSEMFGFRSDLDPDTLADLDNRVRLIAKEDQLNKSEKKELEEIDKRLTEAGFSKAFSDPYYAAFVRAWGRRYAEQMAGKQFLTEPDRAEIDRIATEVLAEAVVEVEKEVEANALR